jgi:GNAT acetyltransferase
MQCVSFMAFSKSNVSFCDKLSILIRLVGGTGLCQPRGVIRVVVSVNVADYGTLCRVLGDTPETVIAIHLLQRGLCSVYAVGEINHPAAIVIQPNNLIEEPTAFGTDAEAIFRVLCDLPGWTCVNVDNAVASKLGLLIQANLRRSVRYYEDVFHTLGRAAATFSHATVRLLTWDDLGLLATAPPEVQEAALGFGAFEGLLVEGFAAGAVVDGGLVALACTTALTTLHADLGVVTVASWAGRGLATACASLVVAEIQQSGRLPVWSADEGNFASLRVAQKLGFEEICRKTYVIPVKV